MSNPFEDFVSELADSKTSKDLQFEIFKGTDLGLGSHVPYGIPTGVPSLDLAIGRPGWPAGRIIEVFGFEAAGKSSLALAAVASAQRMGGFALWIDTESTFDPSWARKNGCNPDEMLIGQVDSIEAAFNLQMKALEAREKSQDFSKPFVMVIDSITAVPSLETLERTFDQSNRIGTDARAIRDSMKRLTGKVADTKALALYINHSIAKTAATAFAKQSQSAGGHALKFFSSIRTELVACGFVKEEIDGSKYKSGLKVKIKMEKNKVCSTGKLEVDTELLSSGFDLSFGLFEALLEIGEIEKVNQKTYKFKVPNSEEVVQFAKAEWPTIIENYSSGPESVYNWFIAKATQKGLLTKYA